MRNAGEGSHGRRHEAPRLYDGLQRQPLSPTQRKKLMNNSGQRTSSQLSLSKARYAVFMEAAGISPAAVTLRSFWSQSTSVVHESEIHSGRRELGDPRTVRRPKFNPRHTRADEFARGAFVHSEEVAVHPVPVVLVVGIV